MVRRLFLACAIAAVCDGIAKCEDTFLPKRRQLQVEVSPGKFLVVHKWDWTIDDLNNFSGEEKTRLSFSCDGVAIEVNCRGIPILLRQYDSKLYMITYDRDVRAIAENKDLPKFSCYRQTASRLVLIDRKDFPCAIATQNMWIADSEVAIIRALDTSSVVFQRSLNAFLWEYLMTGAVVNRTQVAKATLDSFLEMHDPQKLTVIVRPANAR